MVGHVDACAFNHEYIAFAIGRQLLDGGGGHVGKAGLDGAIGFAVRIKLHVVVIEQPQDRGVVVVRGQLCGGFDIGPLRVCLLPCMNQIAAVAP